MVEIYLDLARLSEVTVERTGRYHYRMALVSNKETSNWRYAWGSEKHANRKARRWLKRYLKHYVKNLDRDMRFNRAWTVTPRP